MTGALNLLHVESTSIGYGRYGVKLAEAIERQGVTVYDSLGEPDDTTAAQARAKRAGRANVAAWVSIPTHAIGWWEGQIPVISTMWEATRLPDGFVEALHNFDTVIVPSEQNVELFSEYHPNVKYVPLGVDPDDWHYVERTTPRVFFNFLCGGSGARKGTDLAVEAFNKAFPHGSWGSGPIPRLMLKSPRGQEHFGERIETISGRLTAQEEQDLYTDAHCYVQPSRGEGFGLQPLQALAQGIPTILTDAHGHKAFSHLGYGVAADLKQAEYFVFGDAGDWWEPRIDELVDRMRWVYENWEEAEATAAVAARTVAHEFTWDRTATMFLDAIGRDRLGPYVGDGSWHEATLQRFLVRVNRPWTCDIAGRHYYFEPGKDYLEVADVKRILFEGQLLDPSCFNTGGLLPSQEVLGQSAAYGTCPTCGQQLNRERS